MSKKPSIYLIGGAPRTGKTTLATMVAQKLSVPLTSTDTLRSQLRQTIPATAEPNLYYLDSLNANEADMTRLMREQTAEIIAAADRESSVVWRAVDALVRENIKTGQSIVIEGVAVLPALVARLEGIPHVVHLGNQSHDHTKLVLEDARTHPDTWLGNLKPATLKAFALFCQSTSTHIEREAHKYHQTYIEMSSQPFEQSLQQAFSILTSNQSVDSA